MKSPDEIKKGLSCHMTCNRSCEGCAYNDMPEITNRPCTDSLCTDALALIQQLESDKQQLEGLLNHMNQLRDAAAGRALKMEERVQQLEAERDAAVADLAHVKDCDTCKYDNACLTGKKDCFGCHAKSCPCLICQYEWRGVQKEEKK